MPRILSSTLTAALYGQESSEALLSLITITHPELITPFRFANNLTDVVSRGETYFRSAFYVPWPDEREDEMPAVRLSIDNVDQRITAAIRSLTIAPKIIAEAVLASAPDLVELGPIEYTLKDATYDAFSITGRLAFEDDVLNEAAPSHSFTPSTVPGIF